MSDTMPDNAITGAELSDMMQGYQPLGMCHGDNPHGSVDMSGVIMEDSGFAMDEISITPMNGLAMNNDGLAGPSQAEPERGVDNDIGSLVAKQNPNPFSLG
jgi:hypothetical protein